MKILLEGDIRKWHIQSLGDILEKKDNDKLVRGGVEHLGNKLTGYFCTLSYDGYEDMLIISCGRNY